MPIAQTRVVLLAALAFTLGAVSAEAGPIRGSFSVTGDFPVDIIKIDFLTKPK